MFGLQINRIVSQSMEPTIMTGHKYLINKNVRYEDLKVGDIISFWCASRNNYVTHRVYQIEKDLGIVTKGDNNKTNPYVDPWIVKKEDYQGKVIIIF